MQVVTTILEYDTQVVTATEIKTSSLLMTPEPTWSVETITITHTATKQPQVSTDQVGSGVIKRELVLISVAVTTCVSYFKN